MKGPALHAELRGLAERPGSHKHCGTWFQMGAVAKGPILLAAVSLLTVWAVKATSSMGPWPGKRYCDRLCTAFGGGSCLTGMACSVTNSMAHVTC